MKIPFFHREWLTTPRAIIIGAVVVALALIASSNLVFNARVKWALEALQPSPKKADLITSKDHILGSAEAPVKLVIYTDFECPYCKVFHDNVSALKDNYIKDGKVAIIYRALPLEQLHQKALPEAIASECVAKLAGNGAYWKFVDNIFTSTKSNDGLDLALLSQFAGDLGIDMSKYESCLNDKAIEKKIRQNITNGTEAGAQGTPFPIVFYKNKPITALGGALPTDQLKQVVDQIISTKGEIGQ